MDTRWPIEWVSLGWSYYRTEFVTRPGQAFQHRRVMGHYRYGVLSASVKVVDASEPRTNVKVSSWQLIESPRKVVPPLRKMYSWGKPAGMALKRRVV